MSAYGASAIAQWVHLCLSSYSYGFKSQPQTPTLFWIYIWIVYEKDENTTNEAAISPFRKNIYLRTCNYLCPIEWDAITQK